MPNPIPAGPDAAGKTCPLCGNPIQSGTPAMICPDCHTAHHAQCWQRNGRCGAPGCQSGVTQAVPSPPAQSQTPQSCPTCGYVFAPLETTCARCARANVAPGVEGPRPAYRPARKPFPVVPVLIILVLVAAIVGGGGYYYFTTQQGDISIAYKFTPGQVDKYKITMNMSISTPNPLIGAPKSQQVNIEGVLVQKVLEVNPNGSAKVEIALTDTKITSPALANLNLPDSPDISQPVTLSRAGEIIRDKAESEERSGSGGLFSAGGSTSNPFGALSQLPKRKVDVGQTWTEMVPFADGEIKVTSTLATDNETACGKKTCKISQTYKGNIDLSESDDPGPESSGSVNSSGNIEISGTGVVYFSTEEGRLIKADVNLHIKQTPDPGKQAAPAGTSTVETTMDMAIKQELID